MTSSDIFAKDRTDVSRGARGPDSASSARPDRPLCPMCREPLDECDELLGTGYCAECTRDIAPESPGGSG